MDKAMIALAEKLADAAGDILRGAFRAPVSIERKADASPVTQADRAVETAMRALIEQHYHEHGIVGEEFGNVRPDAPYQWVLDPIDGTRAFMAGYPTFTTLIALVQNGIPVLGIIDQPIMRERWLGITGEPTTLNGKPVHTSKRQTLADCIIATTSAPYYFDKAQTSAFDKLRSQCAHTVIGGDGYGYAMLASGRIDLFVDVGLKPYDFCALKPVIEGAGGVITDWNGQPLTLKSDGRVIAAANAELLAKTSLPA